MNDQIEPDGDDNGIDPSQDVQPPSPYTQEQLERAYYSMQREQNLPMALIAGLVAGIIGAVLWAAITVVSGYQIGWLAVGIGFLVGWSVRTFGKGLTSTYGIIGGALALLSVLAGNYLSIIGLNATEEMPFLQLLTAIGPAEALELMKLTFSPIDLLFYGIAVWEGYKFSFREVSADELQVHLDREGIRPAAAAPGEVG